MPPVGVQQAKSNLDLFNNPYIICIDNCLTFNLTCVLWPIEFVKLDYVSSIEFSIYMLNDPHDTIFIPGKCVNRIFDLPGSLPILFLIGIPEIHFTFHEASNVIFPNESKFLAIISSVFFLTPLRSLWRVSVFVWDCLKSVCLTHHTLYVHIQNIRNIHEC